MPRKDGTSLRAHLETLRDQHGVDHPLLKQQAVPFGAEELWRIFWDLNRGRQNAGFGPSKLSYTDIHAWSVLMSYPIAPWQVDAVMKLDAAFMGAVSKEIRDAT